MHGILAIDKPRGMTSHDVVARVRRLSGQRRIGHAGTLDPMATGVLVLCLGDATRLSEQLMGGLKWYLARVAFGARTDTDDADGLVIGRAPVTHMPAELAAVLTRQVGSLQQLPPAYAAIKQGGVPAYQRARSGQTVELVARPVEVYAAIVLEARTEEADLLICCGKGTYIRSIARDLGDDLGCGAHLAGLRRLASGQITVERCVTLPSLAQEVECGGQAAVQARLLPLDLAVERWPALLLGTERAARVRAGGTVSAPAKIVTAQARLYDMTGTLLALASGAAQGTQSAWHPDRVLSGQGVA